MPDAFKTAYKLYANRELDAARASLEAFLRAHPGDRAGCFLLGVIDLEEGILEGGVRRLEDAAEGFAPPPELCHRAGRLLFEKKEFTRAIHWLGRAVALKPGLAASQYWLGNAQRMTGDVKAAEASLKQAIMLAPAEPRAYISLAYLYRGQNRLEDAAQTMTVLVKATAGKAEVMQKAAEFLCDIHRLDLAEKLLTRLAEKNKGDAPLLVRLGEVRQKLGLFEEAAQCYRRAIIHNASSAAAYLGLSAVKKYESLDDADAIIMAKAIQNNDVGEDSLISAHFALGKVHDDCKSYDEAFRHFQAANELKAKNTPFDADAFKDLAKRIKKTFKPSVFKVRTGRGAKTPVFIVGMLRAGATLAEQVLDAHPKIFGVGALSFIENLVETFERDADKPYPECVPALDAVWLQDVAQQYMNAVTGISAGEPVLVDRTPMNFLHLGLIAVLFPDAKIIHCRRHPLDTCLSVYCQSFADSANAYAYDLKAIAGVYIEYKVLMEHWYSVLPLPIFDLDYEHLVKFPEKVTQKLLHFLEVDWDDAVLEFYKKERTIEAASLRQVKQPLYRSSIERWRHYEKHLEDLTVPFKKASILD